MNETWWCGHIRWIGKSMTPGPSPEPGWYFQEAADLESMSVVQEWNLCPICGAKRPEKKEPEVYRPYLLTDGMSIGLARVDEPSGWNNPFVGKKEYKPLRVNKDGYFEVEENG